MPETTREHAPLIALERVISNERRVFHVTSIASASRRVQDTHGQVNPQVTVDCRTGTNIGPGGAGVPCSVEGVTMEHRGQLWVSSIENMFAGPPEDRFLDLDRHPFYQERVGGGP